MTMVADVTIPESGKKIYVFDDVFQHNWRRNAFKYCLNSKFALGWVDNEDPAHYEQYLHCKLLENEIQDFGILNNMCDASAVSLIKGKPLNDCVINLSCHSDVYYAHTHINTSMLYYANPYWKEEWAGETIFYNESCTETVFTSVYKPGRIIIFDGGIPHTIRAPSRKAPTFRFTVAMFFNMGEGLKPLEQQQ
jgi:hypothetical protein